LDRDNCWRFIATAGFPLLIWQVNAARRQLDAARIQMDEARTQRQDAVRLTRSQVLLAADGVLAHYKEIAQNLRPGGEWYEVLCYRSQHWKIP
jgi:hypothetical protein